MSVTDSVKYLKLLADVGVLTTAVGRMQRAVEQVKTHEEECQETASSLAEGMAALDVSPATVAPFAEAASASGRCAEAVQRFTSACEEATVASDGIAEANEQAHGRVHEAVHASPEAMPQSAFFRE